MTNHHVPFNRPYTTGAELDYITEAIGNAHLSGNGPYARRCASWLDERLGSARSLLTHSCTGALEMAAILSGAGPGDEVIMPSFTFASTANAFVLRGATPVFVDIRPDTLNIDERAVESAITPRTRAICVVHYAGVGCDMDVIASLAEEAGVPVIEDAAQGILATFRGRPLGSLGSLAALSFHETKNVHCGEGGALIINDSALVDRAEVIHEKGTDRRRFLRGQVDKYTWLDIGSSFALSEINSAFLWAQLERSEEITRRRLQIWHTYHAALAELEEHGALRRPVVPIECAHNAHMYHVLLPTGDERSRVIARLNEQGVNAVFHYAPLHASDAGRRYGSAKRDLPVTEDVAERIIRLPLWPGMSEPEINQVIDGLAMAVSPRSVRT